MFPFLCWLTLECQYGWNDVGFHRNNSSEIFTPNLDSLQQAGLEGSTNGWRVSVGGHLVNDWRYKKDGEGAEFVLEGIDSALIKNLPAS